MMWECGLRHHEGVYAAIGDPLQSRGGPDGQHQNDEENIITIHPVPSFRAQR